jgi:hypothetical protein
MPPWHGHPCGGRSPPRLAIVERQGWFFIEIDYILSAFCYSVKRDKRVRQGPFVDGPFVGGPGGWRRPGKESGGE